jgi:hypothetical protein
MKDAVKSAIEEIRASFPGVPLTVHEDGQGGAWFFIEGIDPGPIFQNRSVWVGADIGAQYPYSDIYPVFVSGDLKRVDGAQLGEAKSVGVGFHGRTSVQLSRRSNHRDPGLETAAIKIQKVLAWLASH